jgi:hypothetical protein
MHTIMTTAILAMFHPAMASAQTLLPTPNSASKDQGEP